MFIETNGLRLHYKTFGAPAAPALLFLHGWGVSIEHYKELLHYLSQKFYVVALDLPGFGLSAQPSAVWGTENYAACVAAFAQQLALANFICCGHSLGGKITLFLAAKKLAPITQLILIASAGMRRKLSFTKKMKIYFYKNAKLLARVPLLKIFLAGKISRYQKKIGSDDYRHADGLMRAILVRLVNEDWRHILKEVNVPVLLIWGEKDSYTPLADGKLMAELLPQATLKIIPAAGHCPYLDNFSAFQAALQL